MSRHARYIGRVGGLAFALGVGTAILAGAGTAWAEGTESATGGSEAAQHSDGSPGPAKAAGESESNTDSGSSAESESANEPSATEAATEAQSDSGTEAEAEATATDGSDATGATADDDDAAAVGQVDAEEPDEVGQAQPDVVQEVAARTDKHPAGLVASAETVSTEPVAEVAATSAAAVVNPNPFFDNQTPTLSYNASENTVAANGHILGNLHPVDIDSTTLTYTATKPTFGTVVVNSNGTFDYTPGANYAGQDKFDVTVSDAGSDFHIHGFLGLIDLFTFGLFGLSGHYKTQTVFIGVQRSVVVSGLNSPVDFRFLPDGRLLVAEKGGAIKVVDKNGNVLAQPLLTLSVNTVGERGVSGLAIDPQFATNGHIYVAYTTAAIKDRLSQFTVVGNSAALGTEVVFMESPDTVANYHHGGGLAFGPDGKLYWGKGDNFVGANAQDLTNMYGKILRFNPDGSTPSDNPVLPAGSLPQIYAYGLRNPWRYAFDAGKLYIADVGQSQREEVNVLASNQAGLNFGWNIMEGSRCYQDASCNTAGLTPPVIDYDHSQGCSITGGYVYRGSAIPELQGRFPIRVELQPLTQADLVRILSEPENSLCRQYEALLQTEGVKLHFHDEAIGEIARIATDANRMLEDIGARRLQTILERVLDELSFEAPEVGRHGDWAVEITADYVRQRVESVLSNPDLSKYIL